tara:strand:- start:1336 stop:1551 length:216 start_codon:yes stop_codon:yes gene_type:complete
MTTSFTLPTNPVQLELDFSEADIVDIEPTDQELEDQTWQEDWDSEPDDRWADAEALASAGWGTDEDYGAHN